MDNGRDHRQTHPYRSTDPQRHEQVIYPHSHHGTPAQEYMSYEWAQPPPLPTHMDLTQSNLVAQYHQYPYATAAAAAAAAATAPDQNMPLWPSQLQSDSYAPYKATTMAPPMPHTAPLMNPFAATMMAPLPNAVTNTPNPRRTLTDEDRKEMCQYAMDNPHMKQIEIGAHFKVDRSTVSKVLRHKEKHLATRFSSRTPLKREKSKKGEVENALMTWAAKQKKLGIALTDQAIIEQSTRFAACAGGDISNPAKNPEWVTKFKLGQTSSEMRKDSKLLSEESDTVSNGYSPSPRSQSSARSPAHLDPGTVTSNEDLKSGMASATDFEMSPSQQPSIALKLATVQEQPSFPPNLFQGQKPVYTTTRAAPVTTSPDDRHRRVTFPNSELGTFFPAMSSDVAMPKMAPNAMLDSPMENYDHFINSPRFFNPDYQSASMHSSAIDPATISPSDVLQTRTSFSHGEIPSSTGGPSQAEARAGIETAITYLRRQPSGLDRTETQVMETLKQRINSDASTTGTGSRP